MDVRDFLSSTSRDGAMLEGIGEGLIIQCYQSGTRIYFVDFYLDVMMPAAYSAGAAANMAELP